MNKYDSRMLGKVWKMLEDNKFEVGSLATVSFMVGFLLAVGYLGTIYAL